MQPYGYSIFCEDVRDEIGGKRTLVGTLPHGLYVPQFPFVVAKLAIITNVVLPPGNKNTLFKWQIFFPGDPPDLPSFIAEVERDATIETKQKEIPSEWQDDDVVKINRLSQTVVLSPVQFTRSGLIKVRVVTSEEVVKAGVLCVGIVSSDNIEES